MLINDIEVKENLEIKNYTTYKVGGIAKKVYFPKSIQEFLAVLNQEPKALILGACSNIIFSSQGYDGAIIMTTKMNAIEVKGTTLIAEAGVRGALLAQKALELGLTGFEFMIGFPGSIGGNTYMNAGAHGQSIADSVKSVCTFNTKTKSIEIISNKDAEFGYRTSKFQNGEYVVLSVEFQLKKENPEKIKELMDRNLEFRKTIQPALNYPNAGSVFKNPEHDSAGRLLDKAGVKEFKLDKVEVWEKHANFIVNKGEATSEDILELMYKMHQQVKNTYTINLTPEVRFIGKMTKREEEICQELYKKIVK